MHVLVIPSWYPSGPNDYTGSFFREQALALHKFGLNVGVIYPALRSLRNFWSIFTGPYGVTFENDDGLLTFRGHGMAWFPSMPTSNRWLLVGLGLKIFRCYIKKNGLPDIIHAHGVLYGGVLAGEIYRRYGIPYVITEHSTEYSRGLIREDDRRAAEKSVRFSKKCFAVSNSFSELLSDFFGKDVAEWCVIPNMVNQNFLDKKLTKKLDKNSFSFINVSSLTGKKGVDLLIKSFSLAFSRDENVYLKIAGAGEDRAQLEDLVKSLSLDGRVIFLGAMNREQILDEMSLSDSLVLSSRYETFGVVVVESLALGKPVVATKCGGPEDIVEDGDGVLVVKNSEEEMAKGLLYVYENYECFQSENIRERCRIRYSERVVAEKISEEYLKILNHG